MSTSEGLIKSRRKKKSDVPVHKCIKNSENDAAHKSYGAQFNHRRKLKHKHLEITENNDLDDSYSFSNIPEADRSVHKSRKKALINANEQLGQENQLLNEKLKETEEYFNKKLTKLKEKLNATQKFNEDVVQENGIIKTQYQDLLVNFEDCKVQLEISKYCKNCEDLKMLLENQISNNNVVQASNKQLNEDVSMLKNVVYRLNVQMERYQDRLRKATAINAKPNNAAHIMENVDNREIVVTEAISALSDNHANHPHVPVSWGSVNAHTLGPLLDAYQETIAEKEDIIQNYETETAHFTGKLQDIMAENESLHKRLTEDDECGAKLSIELDKVRVDLKNTKEQNDLLIKKCAMKQDKLEEVLRCYDQKVEQLKRDYNVVVEQYHKGRAEVTTLKERNKSLIDSQDEFKNDRHNYIPVSVHTASVNECKRWYEELKSQYEQEKRKMQEAITSLHDQIETLNKNIECLTLKRTELENKIKSHEKHMKKNEGQYLDLQHTLNEVQLSRTACRKQLHKAMNFAKDLVAEQESLLQTLHLRQRENKVVTKIGSDIASRMDLLKNQLKTVQRDAWHELSSVEQKLQDQDSIIASMKREHDEEVERLTHIIKQKEESNLLLKSSNNSSLPVPHYLLLKERNLNT